MRWSEICEGQEPFWDPDTKTWKWTAEPKPPPTSRETLYYHEQGETLWIDMFEVPQRGRGLGSQRYREFEKTIPPKFTKIKLMAADAGTGNSEGFWRKMGFEAVSRDRKNGVIMQKDNPNGA